MATLLNSRNEFLKSAATRILGAGVYITSGVANAFTIPANGTTTLPGLLTLTAVPSRYVSPQYTWLRRFGDTGDFTVVAGETTPVLNIAGDAAFVTAAGTSGIVQYRVDVIESGTLGANPSSFTLTIPILRQGVNSVVGVLTNESQTVSADVDGVVTAGTIIQSTLVIYNGISDDSANWTASIQSSAGITAGLINGKTISVSLPVNTANGYVDITAVRQGYPNITKRFSITKVNEGDAGANGISPISYEVLVNAPVIARSTSNILSPAAVIVSAFSTTGATKTTYSGRFKIYEDSVLKYTSAADLTTYTYTPTTFNISLLKVELYLAGDTTTLLDTQEIPIVVAGSSGMTLSVSNSSHLIPADNSGAVATYTGSGTAIQVFEGSTPLTYLTTLGTTTSAFTIGTPTLSVASSITVGAHSGSGTTTATVAQHSSMNTSVDSVVISYPITYNRANGAQATQTVTQSITKAKAGTLGIRGSRQVYSTDAAYISTYDFDGAGAIEAGGPSYAAQATSLIATVTAGSTPTTPINGDTVTFSNGSNYVYTITHNGTSWVPPGTIIDGSLLVTGSVTASKINSNGLSIRDSSGNVILSAGTALQNQIAPYQSGATVGANETNLAVGVGANLLVNSDLAINASSWELGWNQSGVQDITTSRNLAGPDWQAVGTNNYGVHRTGTPTGVWDVYNTSPVPVVPGQRYEVSAYMASHRCQFSIGLVFYDSAGNHVLVPFSGAQSGMQGGRDLANWAKVFAFATAPAGARYVRLIFRSHATGEAQPYTWITQPFLGVAGAAQTTPSPWSASNFSERITTANASTWIADAAIGSAQIANASITTAKIGNASVDTLNIAGNAVTVPMFAKTWPGTNHADRAKNLVVESNFSFLNGGSSLAVIVSLQVYYGGASGVICYLELQSESGTNVLFLTESANFSHSGAVVFASGAIVPFDHRWRVRCFVGGGSGHTIRCDSASIVTHGVKR